MSDRPWEAARGCWSALCAISPSVRGCGLKDTMTAYHGSYVRQADMNSETDWNQTIAIAASVPERFGYGRRRVVVVVSHQSRVPPAKPYSNVDRSLLTVPTLLGGHYPHMRELVDKNQTVYLIFIAFLRRVAQNAMKFALKRTIRSLQMCKSISFII